MFPWKPAATEFHFPVKKKKTRRNSGCSQGTCGLVLALPVEPSGVPEGEEGPGLCSGPFRAHPQVFDLQFQLLGLDLALGHQLPEPPDLLLLPVEHLQQLGEHRTEGKVRSVPWDLRGQDPHRKGSER